MTLKAIPSPTGGSISESISLPARMTKTKVAQIGSSYTQQQVTQSSGTQITSQSRSWAEWWNLFANNSLNIDTFLDASDPLSRGFRGANFGVSGQFSDAILARIPDVISKRPDICILQSGSNNVTSVSTVISNVKSSIDALYNSGILPVYLSITFRGALSWTAANISNASQINATIKNYLATTGRGIYIEANKYITDFDSATGRPLAGALDTDDIHYNTWSAFQIGKGIHELLTSNIAQQATDVSGVGDLFDATNNPYGNIWVNPLVSINAAIGTTNGTVGTGVTAGTGTAATSVGRNMVVERNSGAGTAVANVQTRGPGLGNWQTVVFTPSGSGTSLYFVRSGPADTTHTLTAGTWVRVGCTLDASTFGTDVMFSGFQNIALNVDLRDSGSSLGKSVGLSQYSAVSLPNSAFQGVLESPPFQVPVGCDRFRTRLEVIIDDTKTGTGTLKIGSFYVRPEVTAPSSIW